MKYFEAMLECVVTQAFFEDLESGTWHHHHAVIEKRPGSAPNDPSNYHLRDHIILTLAEPSSRL